MNEDKIIIECSCGTHLLYVENVEEYNDNHFAYNTKTQEYNLAMFNYGSRGDKHTFWHRIKYLFTGRIYADQLCLTTDEAKKLAKFINETANE